MLKNLIEQTQAVYKKMESQRPVSWSSKSQYLQLLVDDIKKLNAPTEAQLADQILSWHEKKTKDEKADANENFFKNISAILVCAAHVELKNYGPEYALKKIKNISTKFEALNKSSVPLLCYITGYSAELVKDYNALITATTDFIKTKQLIPDEKDVAGLKTKITSLTEGNAYFKARNTELNTRLKEKETQITELTSQNEALFTQIKDMKENLQRKQTTPNLFSKA